METKFNFNSQVCTTREQSERLLALGLKKETADMVWTHAYYGTWVATTSENPLYEESDSVPAWSLNRLICLLPNYIRIEDYEYGRKYIATLDLIIDSFLNVGYIEGVDEPDYDIHFYANDLYKSICKAIEWLIKEGYFPKEYLVDLTGIDSRQDMVDAFRYAFEVMKAKKEE